LKASTNLKNCRRVCKKWNESILSQTPPRFTTILLNAIPRMERRLAKEISMAYKPMCCSFHYEDRFSQFCKYYCKAVEHLKFDDDERYFANFKSILEGNLFPNLRSLEASFINCSDFPSSLPIMPKLKVISAKVSTRTKVQPRFIVLYNESDNIIKIQFFHLAHIATSDQKCAQFTRN
jgi:hypothetical protein